MFRVFLLTIGVVLSVVMVLKVGVTGFAERLIAAPPYWILLSIALYGLILLLGIFRWTVYLKMLGEEISIKDIRQAYFLNCFVSNLTPGRSGDVLAPKYLSDSAGVAVPNSSAMLIVDRGSDLILLILLFFAGIFVLAIKYNTSFPLDLDLKLVAAALCVIAIIVFSVSKSSYTVSFRRRISGFLREIHKGVRRFATLQRIAIALCLSAVNWFLHICKELFFLNAFISIDFVQVLVCQSVTNIVALLSFVPGGLGVNVASVALITRSMGLDWQGAAVSMTVSTLLFTLIRLILGILFCRSQSLTLSSTSN